MRELKFRAWDIDNKQFIYARIGQDDVWLDDDISTIEMPLNHSDFEQYTGLKDKNGKEIYEGDILKFRGRAYEVKFDKYGQFYIENKNYHWLENGYSFRSVDIWCADGILVEVVGNIHENPELLEQGNAKD